MIVMVLTILTASAAPQGAPESGRAVAGTVVDASPVNQRSRAQLPSHFLPVRSVPSVGPVGQRHSLLLQEHRLEPAKTQSRSRVLALAGLGAGVVSAGLLGGASAVRTSYLDSDEPTKSQYRTNRVLGHAGYGVGVGAGALLLGSVALGEW